MKDLKFVLDDYYDILNLHKGLLEARFHDNPSNYYVAGSPILAKIHVELIQLLKEIELSKNGREGWSEWVLLKNQSHYKNQAINAIKQDSNWSNYDMNRKIEIAKAYIAPFECDETDLILLINEIN